ncbi:MAG: HAMP domain-containing histidine kinase [Desulfosudis oleivorans]|nr:HAMP domain-containing histidine kinase [Desulfosudis oleivorans]
MAGCWLAIRNACLRDGQQECIDEIEKQCEKLLLFSNSLLDFAKIHSEKFTLNREQVDVGWIMCRGMVSNMQIGARDKKVNDSLRGIQAGVDALFIDPIRFEQALTNLIDNAIKHSPEGSRGHGEHLAGRRSGGEATENAFESGVCSDLSAGPGPGNKESTRPGIFSTIFSWARAEGPRGASGSGWPSPRRSSMRHGGQVEARASDSGGYFVITIPLKLQDY